MLKKVRDSLGGRVRLMVVGSAPMAANVLTFMRAALGCTVSGTGAISYHRRIGMDRRSGSETDRCRLV